MIFSFNWIQDYLTVNTLNAIDVATNLSNCTAECTLIKTTGLHLNSIISVKIIQIKAHPQADLLQLVTIEFGNQKQEVVCGANNFINGDIVAYAGIGVSLPNGMTIKKAKIRGVESCGMLCSEEELGLSDDSSGILILANDTPVNAKLSDLYPDQLDYILEIDNNSITNRPDLWGHRGLAREISVIFDVPFKDDHFIKSYSIDTNNDTNISNQFSTDAPLVTIEIVPKQLVPRLVIQGVQGVQIRPSPAWIKLRLHRVGLRAINNLVDISNYVMLDIGQPMHIFDVDRINGKKLQIKLAAAGAKFISLSKQEYILTDKDLAFYDDQGICSLAGVIGGLNSAVVDATTNILLEAGNWHENNLRKTSQLHKIKTDAVQRFEKSLDPELTLLAIIRAWQLVQECSPESKLAGGLLNITNTPTKKITIDYDPNLTSQYLGVIISAEQQLKILQKLGFTIDANQNIWQVTVPSWRATKDVTIFVDLVEEVGRIYGYNRIIPKAPKFAIEAPKINQARIKERLVKHLLVNQAYIEIFNFTFSNEEFETVFHNSAQKVLLLNPNLENQTILKTSLLPHIIQYIQASQVEYPQFKLFELGKIYLQQDNLPLERQQLVLINAHSSNLNVNFQQLQANLQAIASVIQIDKFNFTKHTAINYMDHNYSAIIKCAGYDIGYIFKLTAIQEAKNKITAPCVFAILDYDQLIVQKNIVIKYKEQSKFPPVIFDISLLVDCQISFAAIASLIKPIDNLILAVNFLDRYVVNENNISLTVRIIFRSTEKTLDGHEITNLQNKVIDFLAKKNIHLKK